MNPTILFITAGFFIIYNIISTEREKKKNLKELEIKYLTSSVYLLQFKFQMLEMLKIIYDKAAETDPQFINDYEKIVKSVDNKFEQYANEWIEHLRGTLQHETKYENWQEATRYIEKVLNNNKHKKEDESGKRN